MRCLDELLPKLQISTDDLTKNKDLNPADLFQKKNKQVWLEIGFGSGEHLAALMNKHPDYNFLGAEPFVNGMSAFLKSIDDVSHDNIRVLMDDALILVDSLTDESIDGIYVLNPDPWHKKRHHKRRIIRQETLDKFARILKPEGTLIAASDVDDMAEWMTTEMMLHSQFTWTAEQADDWRTMPPDWIQTRYETKGIEAGRQQTYLIFKKV